MKTKKIVAAIAAMSVLALICYQIILVAEDIFIVLNSLGDLSLGIVVGGLILSNQISSSSSEEKNNRKKIFLFWMLLVLLIFGLINKSSFLVLYSIGIPVGYFGFQILVVYMAYKYLKKSYNFWIKLSKNEQQNVLKHADVFWEKRWGDTSIFIMEEHDGEKLEFSKIKCILQKSIGWNELKKSYPPSYVGVVCDFINFFIPFINQKQMIKNWDKEIYGDDIEVSPELVVERKLLEDEKSSFLREWGIRPDE